MLRDSKKAKYGNYTSKATAEKKKFVPFNMKFFPVKNTSTNFIMLHLIVPKTKQNYVPTSFVYSCIALLNNNQRTSQPKTFIVEVSDKAEGDKISSITNTEDIPCNVTKCDMYNNSRELIYVYKYDMTDTDEFFEGLKEEYPSILT